MNYIEIKLDLKAIQLAKQEEIAEKFMLIQAEGTALENNQLIVYFEETAFNEQEIKNILKPLSLEYAVTTIEPKNWNQTWESNMEPVVIDDQIVLVEPQKSEQFQHKYKILISPEMSFGTGHHPTTRIVLKEMKHLELRNKSVLDLGSGTGVLAIFAGMLGADFIVANDIDDFAYRNTRNNLALNQINAAVFLGDKNILPDNTYHLILANISKNTTIEHLPFFKERLEKNGILISSGYFEEDMDEIKKALLKEGFIVQRTNKEEGWACIVSKKE